MIEIKWSPSKQTEGNWVYSYPLTGNDVGGWELWTFVIFKSKYSPGYKIRFVHQEVNRMLETTREYSNNIADAEYDSVDEAKDVVEEIVTEHYKENNVEWRSGGARFEYEELQREKLTNKYSDNAYYPRSSEEYE